MFTDDRNAYRRSFFEAWEKHLRHLPLEPLEAQLVSVMQAHPEYHVLLGDEKRYLTQAFEPEENPFMHLSLHLAVREQIHLNRPNGVTSLYQTALLKYPNPHEAEHELVETLGRLLWEAQRDGVAVDEAVYLEALREGLREG